MKEKFMTSMLSSYESKNKFKFEEIKWIDPSYFKLLKLEWKIFIKSKNKVHYINKYWTIEEIKGLSPFWFQVIDKIFIRDRWKIYWFIRESTRNSSAWYNHFYWVNADSFKVITSIEVSYNKEFREWIFIDDKYVYSYNLYWIVEKFEEISPIWFKSIWIFFRNLEKLYYFSDLWWKKELFVDDLDTFTVIEYPFYWDKNHIYFFRDIKLNKLEYIDRNSFKIIDLYYIKDKYWVFFCEWISSSIMEIDWKYFNTPGWEYKLISTHPETFQKIDDLYYKDQYNVYYRWKKIENLEPNTFKIIEWDYYEDNNYYCIWEKIIEKNKYINYHYYLWDFLILHWVDKTYIKTKKETHEFDITENKQLTVLSSWYFLWKENIYYFYSWHTTSERRKPATTSESWEWRSDTTYYEDIIIIWFESREWRELLVKYWKQDLLNEYYKNKN